jgi:hypothetical protein
VAWLIRQFFPDTAFGWASMLVQALAWPASAVVIAALFRAEVRLVLERMVRLKFRDFEAQFHRELQQTEELAEGAAPKRLLDLPDESRRVIREVDLAPTRPSPTAPRALIESAWSELSAAADRAAGTVGVDPAPALAARGALCGLDLVLFDRLRWLHAEVARAVDWRPTPDVAARFAGLARSLAGRLGRSTRAT